MNEQLLSPPESYPIPDTGMRNHEQTTYIGESIEEKKELLVVTRNSLEILSSIMNSDVEPKPIKDDLAVSMLENCKQSLAVIQRIVESTSGDEGLMFEALNLHDELRQVISRYEEMEAALDSGEELPKTPEMEVACPTQLQSREKDCLKHAKMKVASLILLIPAKPI